VCAPARGDILSITCAKGTMEPAHSQTCFFFLASPLTLQPKEEVCSLGRALFSHNVKAHCGAPRLKVRDYSKQAVAPLATARRTGIVLATPPRRGLQALFRVVGEPTPPRLRSPFPPLLFCVLGARNRGGTPWLTSARRFPPPPFSALFLAPIHFYILATRTGAPFFSPSARGATAKPHPLPPPQDRGGGSKAKAHQ